MTTPDLDESLESLTGGGRRLEEVFAQVIAGDRASSEASSEAPAEVPA